MMMIFSVCKGGNDMKSGDLVKELVRKPGITTKEADQIIKQSSFKDVGKSVGSETNER